MLCHGWSGNFIFFLRNMFTLYQLGSFANIPFNDLIISLNTLRLYFVSLALLHVERRYFSLGASTSSVSARFGVVMDALLCSSIIAYALQTISGLSSVNTSTNTILLHENPPVFPRHTEVHFDLTSSSPSFSSLTFVSFSLCNAKRWRVLSHLVNFTFFLQSLARCFPERQRKQRPADFSHSIFFSKLFVSNALQPVSSCPLPS